VRAPVAATTHSETAPKTGHSDFPPPPEQASADNLPAATVRAPVAATTHSEIAPASVLPAISQPAHTPAPAPPPLPPASPTAPFPAPDLHADNFPDALGAHIQWLTEHKIGHAHLHLNPQDMGPLEVRLTLDGEQLQAHFTSAEPEVRQTLEQGLPRLRELLGEHGLNLGQADIGQHPSQQHTSASPHTEASSTAEDTGETPAPDAQTLHIQNTHLLDAWA